MEQPPKETISDEDLAETYNRLVGVNPKFRAMSRDEMLAGIADPEAEKIRLREIDIAEDKEELQKPYRGR